MTFVTSSVAVFEAAICVKLMYDKIVMKIRKEFGDRRNLHTNLHLKEALGMEFTAC